MLKLKNNNFKKKYIIKVPKDIKVTYCVNKNLIIFSGKLKKEFMELKVKIILFPKNNIIIVSDIPVKVGLKNFKKLQGTTAALIKQRLIEISYLLFIKLCFVGVGYRVFFYKKFDNQVYFKLGYSHLVYFNIPNELSVFCNKSVKIFLFGKSSYNKLTQTAAQIRFCKIPEIYKGKGILYNHEKVLLKKGKKI